MCQLLERHMEKNADYIHNEDGENKSVEGYLLHIHALIN